MKVGIMQLKVLAFFLLGCSIWGTTYATGEHIRAEKSFCDVGQFGASGKKSQNATPAFRRAVEACAGQGGGTVYVGPGAYVSGPIELKDNITLFVDAGATIYLNSSPVEFNGYPNALIYSQGAKNISISGKGTLDGQAQYRWGIPESEDSEISEETSIARAAGEDMRRSIHVGPGSHLIWIQDSTDVHIDDISIVNSSDWSVRIDNSERIFVQGVYVYSSLTMGVNGDGIDLVSSRDVTISDSVITTGDDSIVLKTIPIHGVAKPIENVTVTNCILTSSSTPLMIGTETFADIRHVLFNNIVIRNSNKGFGINVQDGATVSDVVVSNVTMELNRRHWNWWGSAETFKIVLKKRDASSQIGAIKNIVLDNIISHARGTSLLQGLPERPLENIRISRLQIFMEPEDAADKRATDALQAEKVNGLKLEDIDISWSEDHAEHQWRSALALQDVTDFIIDDFSGRDAPQSGSAAIILNHTREGVVSNSRAKEGCNVFVAIRGGDPRTVHVANSNNMSRAAKPIALSDGVMPGSAACERCK